MLAAWIVQPDFEPLPDDPERLPPCLLPVEADAVDLVPERASADWRLPWLMLPARRASSDVNSWAVPF